MMNKTLILVRGVPGSGKSTLAKMLCPIDNICEADKYFMKNGSYQFDASKLKEAHAWCRSQVEARMQLGEDRIVVSITFSREWEMAAYFELAQTWGYIVMSLIVENRHGAQNIHGVPEEHVDAMRQRFEIKL